MTEPAVLPDRLPGMVAVQPGSQGVVPVVGIDGRIVTGFMVDVVEWPLFARDTGSSQDFFPDLPPFVVVAAARR